MGQLNADRPWREPIARGANRSPVAQTDRLSRAIARGANRSPVARTDRLSRAIVKRSQMGSIALIVCPA